MSSDGMTRVIDSGCALYLLSSHPAQASVTQSNVTTTHPGQLLDSRLQMNGSFAEFSCSHDAEDKAANPEMMFLMGPDGFLDNGAQMLPILLEHYVFVEHLIPSLRNQVKSGRHTTTKPPPTMMSY
ncbi:hypothetical protein GBA52_011715 [Prunus armeniaca]|nr:hypothetical protein GBA52_011715 [Prunus armeniaca]